ASAGAGNTTSNTVGKITSPRETTAAPTGTVTPTTVAPLGTVLDSGTDTCHRAASTGTGPTTPTTPSTAPTSTPPSTPSPNNGNGSASGYWMTGSDGSVYGFGAARSFGHAPPSAGARSVDFAAEPDGNGYWVYEELGNDTAAGVLPPLD